MKIQRVEALLSLYIPLHPIPRVMILGPVACEQALHLGYNCSLTTKLNIGLNRDEIDPSLYEITVKLMRLQLKTAK